MSLWLTKGRGNNNTLPIPLPSREGREERQFPLPWRERDRVRGYFRDKYMRKRHV